MSPAVSFRIAVIAFVVTTITATQLPRLVSTKEPPAVVSREFVSDPYVIDRVYPSMEGPSGHLRGVSVLPNLKRELVWLTGFETEVIANGGTISNNYFCHSNLLFDDARTSPSRENSAIAGSLGERGNADWRLFTLVPGRMRIQFPSGFGIPIYSDTPLDFMSMVMNQAPLSEPVTARVKGKLTVLRHADQSTMTPLFRRAIYIAQPLTAETGTQPEATPMASESCSEPHVANTVQSASTGGVIPQFGSEHTMHWMVPPGAHRYTTVVHIPNGASQLLSTNSSVDRSPLDLDSTRIHYATAHLHPYGRELILRDQNTGEAVLRFTAITDEKTRSVTSVSEVISASGIALSASHSYELEATYENPLSEEVDAMAIVYLFLSRDS